MRNHQIAIFCTAAEDQIQSYLDRVRRWYDMLSPFRGIADFYCSVDGKLPEHSADDLDGKIIFIENVPKLGRINTAVFPGWKRSYGVALDYLSREGYQYITHIENDVKIFNFDKVKQYLYTYGIFSSWCHRYNFPEAAFQILNAPLTVQAIAKRYSSNEQYRENDLFEDVLRQYPFEFPFSSTRLEGDPEPPPDKFDFVAQIHGRWNPIVPAK